MKLEGDSLQVKRAFSLEEARVKARGSSQFRLIENLWQLVFPAHRGYQHTGHSISLIRVTISAAIRTHSLTLSGAFWMSLIISGGMEIPLMFLSM